MGGLNNVIQMRKRVQRMAEDVIPGDRLIVGDDELEVDMTEQGPVARGEINRSGEEEMFGLGSDEVRLYFVGGGAVVMRFNTMKYYAVDNRDRGARF